MNQPNPSPVRETMTPGCPPSAVIAELLRTAALAPSMHNTQPWRFGFIRASQTIELYADPSRMLAHSDPTGRAVHIACGAALFNLRLAAAVDGRMKFLFGLVGPVRAAQPEHGQQQRLAVIWEQPDHGFAASHRRRQPQVEQGRAARDVHRAAMRVAVRQHAGRIGVELDRLAGGDEAEPPGLGVMHRRRQGSRPEQLGYHRWRWAAGRHGLADR